MGSIVSNANGWVEQVSMRYFSIFDFFALCCGFGGSGGADWRNCHVWCSDCVGDSDVSIGAASFTPRDWCQSIRSLPSDLVNLINPCGSLTDEMPALVNEHQIKSLHSGDCACKKKHGFHECQHRHRRCTCILNWPSWVPRRMPTASRKASSVRRSPHVEMGNVDSQSPLSAAQPASSLAR